MMKKQIDTIYFRFRLICFLCLLSETALAQKHFSLAGKLVDSLGKPVDFAAITVLNEKDNSPLYQGFSTDSQGMFRIELAKNGDFVLKFQKIGYKTTLTGKVTLTAAVTDTVLSPITMPVAIGQLAEVVIKSSRPLVEQQLDKVVMHVEGNVLSRGDNALDVFRMGPGLTVDSRNQVKLNNKNVVILVNGHSLPGGAQAAIIYLRSLSATDIKDVELIANPSSQYDASGGAAVINIIPKKMVEDGLKGNVFGSYDYSKLNSGNVFSSLTLKKSKTTLGFTGGVSSEADKQVLTQHQYFSGTGSSLNSKRTDFKRKKGIFLNFTFNYDIASDAYFGVGAGYNALEVDGRTSGLTQVSGTATDSSITLNDLPVNHNQTFNVNAFYHKDFKNKGALDLKFDYWDDGRKQDRSLSAVSSNGMPVDELNDKSNDNLKNYSAKIDYAVSGKNSSRFSAGLKSSITDFSYDLTYGALLTDLPGFIGGTFTYRENINAAYLNETLPKMGTWSFQAGLRLENTNTTSNSSVSGDDVNRSYTDLFPSFALQKDIKGRFLNALNLSYSRRLFRPRYDYLNPLDIYQSSFSYSAGNPFIQPEYLDQTVLNFTFFKKYFLVLNWSRNVQSINSEVNQATELVSYTTYNNLSSSNNYSAAINLPLDVKRFHLNSSFIFNYRNQLSTFNRQTEKTYKSNFAFNASAAYTFPKDYLVRVNAFYTGATVNGQLLYGSRSNITLNFAKTWNRSLTLSLKFDDPLYINYEKYSIQTPFQRITSENKWNSRVFGVSLIYLFKSGKSFSSRRVEKTNTEEINRRN